MKSISFYLSVLSLFFFHIMYGVAILLRMELFSLKRERMHI